MPEPSTSAKAQARRAASQTATTANIAGRIQELRVSGNLMTLDAGLFCLFQQPGVMAPPRDGSGLPGVRISIPPRGQTGGAQGQVTIRGLHDDGWLGPQDGAALVRVTGAPAQIMITVYQSPDHPAEAAPRLQVVPLSGPSATAPAPAQPPAPTRQSPATTTDVVAHLQRVGDTGVNFGEWLGKPGSGNWVEGFALSPRADIAADDIEYQAVLGRGWLSPWITGGKFCGSRGMALPLLGLNVRLRGKAAELFTCEYQASFVDGTRSGPVAAGKSCEASSLSPMEAFRITVRAVGAAPAPRTPARSTATRPAAKSAAKPPARKPAAKAPLAPARKRAR